MKKYNLLALIIMVSLRVNINILLFKWNNMLQKICVKYCFLVSEFDIITSPSEENFLCEDIYDIFLAISNRQFHICSCFISRLLFHKSIKFKSI